jgi:hypothetical protein
MSEKAIAETQYNDLKGTTAFDGHEGPPLHELAKRTDMPKEDYIPIGFELWRLNPTESGLIPFHLLAVKQSEVGDNINKAKELQEIPAYRFDGSIPPSDFPVCFKRIDIKAINKNLPADRISITRPEGYGS